MDRESPEYKKYQAYLLSPEWAAKRQKKFKQAGKRCQYCGRGRGQGIKVQIHHLNYDSLYNEKMSDLAVACPDCHKLADQVRKMESGRNTFMIKKYGLNWTDNWTLGEATKEFQQWLQTKIN